MSAPAAPDPALSAPPTVSEGERAARPRRRWGPVRVARLAVSFGLLAWVVTAAARHQGTDALVERLREVRPLWLLVACLLPCAAILMNAVRWRILLAEEHIAPPLGWAVRHTLIGRFVGAFTPSTTGIDGYRTLAAARRSGDPAAASRALVLEKVVGLVGLAAVTTVCASLGVTGVSGRTVWIGVALCLAFSGVGYGIARRPALVSGLLPRWRRLARLRTMLGEIAGTSARPGPLLSAFALGVLNHTVTAAVFVAAAWAVRVDLGAAALFGLGNALVIAALLPISVGGMGVREGMAVVMLGTVGIGEGPAILVAVVGYLAGQTPAVLGGLLSMFAHD